MNTDKIIESILSDFAAFNIDDIPNIDLYMDQVTTYLNNKFEGSKRNEEDKLLTKTMINNYAKSRLLPPPEKKKYSKDHIILLTMIFYLKNIISISDIDTALSPLIEEYFHDEKDSLEGIFKMFIQYMKDTDDSPAILSKYEKSKEYFSNFENDNKDYLQTLTLIATLTYECLARKMIIEKLIDSLPKEENKKDKDKDKVKEKKDKEASDNKENKK